ncbi:threonylcarbamoyl-AMP synthase [Candidatus Woesearchaeota archaeon]|nr:threonylcarbamoyl-AMP synthase [Candidatus Woesearchaeota archaeon]
MLITKEWKEKDIVKSILRGDIIIFPTDTIYGIGCNALIDSSVKKIREIKEREEKPFSIIAPSKRWITYNFIIKNRNYIKKLPGPYTFILEAKHKNLVSKYVNPSSNSLGIRIPDHKIAKAVAKSKVPFVATSVNLSGKPHITEIPQIPKKIALNTDLILDQGPLKNKPSIILDLRNKIAKIIKR